MRSFLLLATLNLCLGGLVFLLGLLILRDHRAPFRAVIRRRRLRHNTRYTVRAKVRLAGGGRVTRTRSFRNC